MTQPIAPEFVLLQQAVIGRYSLERELGRGGMGIVFLARDVALDRPVAIKLLPPALAAKPGLRERFLREARTAARLSHPNIVAIHAVEEAGELVFFVMTYVDGQTVGDLLRARGALTPSEAARMIQEVAWALGYAHGRGLVHRDVKPDNIMVERASGRAIVMDFGIAGAAGDEAEAFGTAQYVSPEQAQGAAVDGRSDLYSLGVVSFLALTGQLPLDAPDTPGMLAMHITRPAPLLLSVAPGMPRKLAHAIDRCLAKDPAERFADGEALAESVGASVEPQRQLPVPVRLWLNKAEQDRSAWILLWFGVLGPPTSMLLAWIGTGLFGYGTLVGLVAVKWYALAPLVAGSASRIWQLRKLLAQGYSVEDAKLAVKDLVERRREELSFEFGREPPLWAKVDRAVMITSGVTFFGFGAAMFFFPTEPVAWGLIGSGIAWLGSALLQTLRPGKRITGDTYAEWRLKFWNSRLGKLFEKIARFGLKPRAVPAELTHRPTELAIGIAADSLFESLPKEQRRELKELPSVLSRLQDDATRMRHVVDELDQALAQLADTAARRPDAEREQLRAGLAAQRDEAAARQAQALGALEGLRLNLLRLKAGIGSVGELTADLSAARSLTETMHYATEGNAEVERLLKRQRTPTPPGPLVPNHG